MKHLLLVFTLLLMIPGLAMANNDDGKKKKKKKGKTIEIREDRRMAITAEAGWNSLAGIGLNGTYYVTPNVAIDAGAGISWQIIKGGLRGRYLFSTKNFTPYVGAGIICAPISIPGLEVTDTDGFVSFVDLKSSFHGQLIGGLEYMTNGGFVIGMNLGYAILLNDNYDTASGFTEPSDFSKSTLKIFYGSGLAIGFNIGYAF